MKFHHWKVAAGLDERMRIRNKIRVAIAAVAALAAVAGICMAIVGLFEFDHARVVAGLCVLAVSTVTYIVMLTRAS